MRIFWAFNNKWLIDNEVEALIKEGHSVFIAKHPDISVNSFVTYRYDKDLCLPLNILDELNNINFFSENLQRRLINIVDEYFDIAILDLNENLLQSFIMFSEKKIILKPIKYCSNINITQWIKDNLGFWALKKLEKMKNRFFVSIANNKDSCIYNNDVIRSDYSLDFPITLLSKTNVEKFFKIDKTKDLLFVCPEIKSDKQSNENYRIFEKIFKDFSYEIIGKQLISITNNKKVINLNINEKYIDYINNYKVLFYMSTDEKEIPYYLYEAIYSNIPIVYLSGGYLDLYKNNLISGRCEDFEQAKRLCKKIISGDISTKNRICNEQINLLDAIYNNYSLKIKNIFTSVNNPINHVSNGQAKKLAFILPDVSTDEVVEYAITFILALKRGAELAGAKLNILLGYPQDGLIENKEYLKKLNEYSIEIRSYIWEKFDKERIDEALQIQGYNFKNLSEHYFVMNDGIIYFEDCDSILFASDRIKGELYSIKPYGVVLQDYIQRYKPEIFQEDSDIDYINVTRGAVANFALSSISMLDGIQYAGLKKRKIKTLPLFFDLLYEFDREKNLQVQSEEYYLLYIDSLIKSDYIYLLNTLTKYYEKNGKIKCLIYDANQQQEETSDDSHNFYGIINKNPILKSNLSLVKNKSKDSYYKLLLNCKSLILTEVGLVSPIKAFEASILSIPTISYDYPLMRYVKSKTEIDIMLYNKDKLDNLLELLRQDRQKNTFATKNQLEQFTIKNDMICKQIYDLIHENLPV